MVKVLLVDDEPEFVAIPTQRLTKINYSVTSAHSGKDALAKLEKDKDIEVVILDVKETVSALIAKLDIPLRREAKYRQGGICMARK